MTETSPTANIAIDYLEKREDRPPYFHMARIKAIGPICGSLFSVKRSLSLTGRLQSRLLPQPHARSTRKPILVLLGPVCSRRYASSLPRASMQLHQTPLHNLHITHSAKMVPYAGYSMPVQYSDMSLAESHNWTRQKASLFDVSHMSVGFSFL